LHKTRPLTRNTVKWSKAHPKPKPKPKPKSHINMLAFAYADLLETTAAS
jgi:hypothetical protein